MSYDDPLELFVRLLFWIGLRLKPAADGCHTV